MLCRQILGTNINCCLISESFIIDQSVFISKLRNEFSERYSSKYILSLLTSTLVSYYFKNKANEFDALFPKIKIGEFKTLPVFVTSIENQTPFIEKADLMLSLNKNLQEESQKFQRTIQRKFFENTNYNKGFKPLVESIGTVATVGAVNTNPLPKNLQEWYLLSYAGFIKELNKQKIELTLSQEAEWEDYFLTESKKVQAIKAEIEQTDKEIDALVYQLYGLTDEEIKIVEGN